MEAQVENRLRNSAAVWLLIESGEGEDRGQAATFVAAGFLATLNYPPITSKHTVTTITYGAGAEAREAQLVYVDRTTSIALLRLTPSESDRRFEAVPLLDTSFPDVTWEVPAFDPRINSFITIRGDVLGLQPSGEMEVIALRPHSEPPSWEAFVGATLFLNDFVAGMVVLARPDVSELHAVPSTTLKRILEDYFLQGNQPAQSSEQARSDSPGRSSAQAKAPPPEAEKTPLDLAALWPRLSNSSRRAFAQANGISRHMGKDKVHMEHLILGLYEKDGGPTRKELDRGGIDHATLRRRLAQIAEEALPEFGAYQVTELTALPPLSDHVLEAMRLATFVAAENNSEEIQSRHLFWGVLSTAQCSAVHWMLEDYQANRAFIDMSAPPSRRTDVLAPRTRAQVNPDRPDGNDLLDVQNEVDAISTVIAARDTEPPLSIGLFGDWGTGKSFFMSRMEKKVNDLMQLARRKNDTAYCPNIVQLRFNAWHYMDTDLWASLAAEIFEGLARELDRDRGLLNGKENPAVARARLLASTSHLRALTADAEQRKVEADATLRASEERLSSLAEDERFIEAKLQPEELLKAAYRFVAAQPVTARSLEDAAAKMGIPKAKALTSDTRATLLEVRSVWDGVRLAFRKTPKRLWILLSLCVALVLAVLWAALQYRNVIAPILVAVAGFLGVAIPFLRKVIPPVKEALGIIHNARAANDALINETRDRRENELRQQHQAVQERVAAEEATIARATQEMAALEKQLESLRADVQVDEYVRARHQSSDYTKHFGVIARARHDFEQLSDLLKSSRREAAEEANGEQQNKEAKRPPRIDRIILYIDDLDRCPEAKVVDVLQAVHLLMALPLFIVVVAVDSRWLLHSLRQQASVFKMSDELIEGMDEEERFHWESTPFNYLEKIFQIPFNLRPIDEDGFVRLIDELTKPTLPQRRSAATPSPVPQPNPLPQIEVGTADAPVQAPLNASAEAHPPVGPIVVNLRDGSTGAPSPAQGSVPRPTAAGVKDAVDDIDPNPPFLDLTQGERRFMHQMHRLIPTPRAAKRYVNVYRLLRASLPDKRRRSLEEEKSERSHCVLLMLAILTGFPQEGAVILRELVERKPKGSWWEFVALLAGEAAQVPDSGRGQNGSAQRAQRWRELNDRLVALRGDLSSKLALEAPCDVFHEWARLVARYSFESGRVLTVTAQLPRSSPASENDMAP